jgi:hypothetical protein
MDNIELPSIPSEIRLPPEISKRKFYKQQFVVEILSEFDIDRSKKYTASEIAEICERTASLVLLYRSQMMDGQKAVIELARMGAKPNFFKLNEYGCDEENDE